MNGFKIETWKMELKKLILAVGSGFIVGILVGFGLSIRLSGVKETVPTVKVDTVKVADTVYHGGVIKAYGCDTLFFSYNSFYGQNLFLSQTQTTQSHQWKPYRFGFGVGVKYGLDHNLNYFILGEYVLRDYFSIGGYASTGKEIGVYGKVRF